MILILRPGTLPQEVRRLQGDLRAEGYESYCCAIGDRTVVAVPGGTHESLAGAIRPHPVLSMTDAVDAPPLVSKAAAAGDTRVPIGGPTAIGGGEFAVIAGPCAVESANQVDGLATLIAAHGAVALRGGAFKPRTSPYSFQGLGRDGLELLAAASRQTGLPLITEVVEPGDVPLVAQYAAVLQIGTRNAQNFSLLRAAGQSGRPVLLKRGFGCTVAEWLNAAEYVLRENNPNVILCERGIRTFGTELRFLLDISAVALVKRLSHLPVIVDPSHATGQADLVAPLTLAAAAAGADGVLLDVRNGHPSILCDGPQALPIDRFRALVEALDPLLGSVGRRLARGPQAPWLVAQGRGRPALSA